MGWITLLKLGGLLPAGREGAKGHSRMEGARGTGLADEDDMSRAGTNANRAYDVSQICLERSLR